MGMSASGQNRRQPRVADQHHRHGRLVTSDKFGRSAVKPRPFGEVQFAGMLFAKRSLVQLFRKWLMGNLAQVSCAAR
jgi:hypothetical protein